MMGKEFPDLERALILSVKKCAEKRLTIAFSGGIDSSLLAHLFKTYTDSEITLETSATKDSRDFEVSKLSAELLGLPHKLHILEKEKLPELSRECMEVTGCGFYYSQIALPLFFVAKNSKNKVIISGAGADEIFFGYKKYEKAPEKRNPELETLEKGNLVYDRLAVEHFGKELRTPYLAPYFVSSAMKFSAREHLREGRKTILRKLARALGLPDELADRPKKAAQYSSGVHKSLRK